MTHQGEHGHPTTNVTFGIRENGFKKRRSGTQEKVMSTRFGSSLRTDHLTSDGDHGMPSSEPLTSPHVLQLSPKQSSEVIECFGKA